MEQLVKWGEPAIISERIYNRGCIKLPDLNLPVDIKLMNEESIDTIRIGEAYLIENEEGIFVDNIEWFIDIEKLDEIMNDAYIEYLIEHPDDMKYIQDITIAMSGNHKSEYLGQNEIQFEFLMKYILTEESVTHILRELNLDDIVD